MHNVRRVQRTAEQLEARRQREAGDVARFKQLDAAVLSRKNDVPTVLRLTSQILKLAPEHYTAWNIRREAIEKLRTAKEYDDDPTIYRDQLLHELKFTQALLIQHPKNSWTWTHRRWALSGVEGAVDQEILLVDKLLTRDPRNFHGWTYRRWVLKNQGIANDEKTIRSELEFTMHKINQNFSNFSAWHHRVQQLKALAAGRPPLSSELEYVRTAIFMDPQDESAWRYYLWLLEGEDYSAEVGPDLLKNEREEIQELYDEEKCKFAARVLISLDKALNQPVNQALLDDLIEIDPMRAQMYRSLAHACT